MDFIVHRNRWRANFIPQAPGQQKSARGQRVTLFTDTERIFCGNTQLTFFVRLACVQRRKCRRARPIVTKAIATSPRVPVVGDP